MEKMIMRIKNRLESDGISVLLKADIRSLTSNKPTPMLGFVAFFLGGKEFGIRANRELYKTYFDEILDCFNFNGVRITKEIYDKRQFTNEVMDILSPYLESVYGFPASALDKFHEGPYEYKEITVNKGDVVIDAGANIGIFSALAAKKSDEASGGTVHAFEPVPFTIELLKRTSKLNGNIILVPLALSDTVGEASITLDEDIGSNSIITQGNSGKTISIKTITLDEYAHQNNLRKIDFIKADIEGAERLMLAGAKYVLKDFAPKLSLCTYHLADDPKVMRDLILSANSKYVIYQRRKKMHAFVPNC